MRGAVHLIVPDGFDDPARPSGGNVYDRRIAEGLAQQGWHVHLWRVPESGDSVADLSAEIPDEGVVLVDGLIAAQLPESFLRAARVRLVVLAHMLPSSQSEAEVLSAADAIIATSAWTRDTLVNVYDIPAERVRIARPGVDGAELAPANPDGGRLLCVATVADHKGQDVLIEALDRIAELPWHCRIVGSLDREPGYVEGLHRQLSTAGIAARVDFTGALAGDALAHEYESADLLVLASRSESYGMVLTEALARGIPVVATDVGGIPEAIGTAADGTVPGLLVAPDDVAALAGALAQWLQDLQLRSRLRVAAQDRRNSLPTWSESSARIGEVLAG